MTRAVLADAGRAGGRRARPTSPPRSPRGSGGPQGWPDDVAVLVAHRRAAALEPLQAGPAAVPPSLPGVRRRLGGWLAGLGMGEQDRVGVMVAVGEACANAAEHAYRGQRARADVGPRHVDVDGVLTVTVRDEGTWRPPDRDPGDRGRGLLIMRQLVDTRDLDERRRGTTVTLGLRLRRTPDVDPDARRAPPAGRRWSSTGTVARPVVPVSGAVDEVSCRAAAHPAARGQPRRHRAGWSSTWPGSALFSSAGGPGGAGDRPHRPRRGLAAGRARARRAG